MASTPISSGLGNLANLANTVAATAQALLAAGNVANSTDLWPVQSPGTPDRIQIAGVTQIESAYHYSFEQGRFLETSLGDAIYQLQAKKLDLDEKILTYLNINKLAIDGQLSDVPRAIKYAADSVTFVQQIQQYTSEITGLLNALQANVQVLLLAETRMQQMIQANINALSNLLQEICNWQLPSLPSLRAQLGQLWHWNGFNFNSVSGFKFNPSLSLPGFNTNFTFGQCSLLTPNLASFFASTPTSVSDGSLTFSPGTIPVPENGTYGDPTQLTNPSYISSMQATTTPVYNPDLVAPTTGTSLPDPAAIISDYALPASTYTANVISAVVALQPIIIQPGDPDYVSGIPTTSRSADLRSLLIRFINLADVVSSNYDPNTTAAWLLYLNLNRAGRGGTWIQNFQAAYTTLVAPSISYLQNTPVPWNTALGGPGTSDAPAAIPLITTLQADTTGHLLWQLSYIEASLLGYPRTRTWDSAADTTYTANFTGTDLDYVPTPYVATPTVTIVLGADTAQYPVSATVPVSMTTVFNQVVTMATANIAAEATYQSVRPQFRFTYNMFAQASLVDKYTQFWRDFNANLVTFLTQDPYLIAFTTSYVGALDAALDPLANSTDYSQLQADVATRNRTWTPGSDLLPIPSAVVMTGSGTAPTDLTNGWTGNDLDAATFLSRPDIQAQTIPVQMAMLRTNQSYAALSVLQGNLTSAASAAIASAQAISNSIGTPGWEVENDAAIQVPPGAAGLALSFPTVDFDQSNYVDTTSTIEVQSTNPYILSVVVNWDTGGATGTRMVVLLQNGVVVVSNSVDDTSTEPFTNQFSTVISLNQGDILQVVASHTCATAQNILSGANFLGLLDPTATIQTVQVAPPTSAPTTPSTPSSSSATGTFAADQVFPALTACSIGTDDNVIPVNPNVTTPGVIPSLDGIALNAANTVGGSVSLAMGYGSTYTVTSANFTVGGLLYVASDGTLTQDYTTITATVRWIICVGKALTATSFIYQPHLPVNYIQTF